MNCYGGGGEMGEWRSGGRGEDLQLVYLLPWLVYAFKFESAHLSISVESKSQNE